MLAKYFVNVVSIWVGIILMIGIPLIVSDSEHQVPSIREIGKGMLYALLLAASLAGLGE
jgi:predicted tellurium resistance membrane protein TerC